GAVDVGVRAGEDRGARGGADGVRAVGGVHTGALGGEAVHVRGRVDPAAVGGDGVGGVVVAHDEHDVGAGHGVMLLEGWVRAEGAARPTGRAPAGGGRWRHQRGWMLARSSWSWVSCTAAPKRSSTGRCASVGVLPAAALRRACSPLLAPGMAAVTPGCARIQRRLASASGISPARASSSRATAVSPVPYSTPEKLPPCPQSPPIRLKLRWSSAAKLLEGENLPV